ncbi:MAG: ABC transporter ATP-binding protein [Desulfobacterales bacterium]|jgi:oligopeptide/dipeptide ABC transporter ATP-binding protein|nr:ABC transporter ATP-binding protein [Desulfobacteraceae bacterium]MDY0310749.1 ABC transporter ATP-binding protein [Desulfobacterales bacterium]
MNNTILRVERLSVSFATEKGRLTAVEDVSFSLRRGETLGLVGESGCGKSVTALSIMRLLPRPAGRIEAGRIMLENTDLLRLPAADLPGLRGRRIAMIFQEPMTALNPVHRLGQQVAEAVHLHRPELDDKAVGQEVVAMLKQVRIPEPTSRVKAYPHQISGGMRQRVMIAMALAARPDILIADEPTTALDVTIQAQILSLMRDLQAETGTAIIFITHDLGVIAELCHRVAVMYAGRIVESAAVETLFRSPRHPYTQGLLAAIPRLDRTPKAPLATIEGTVPALDTMPPGCRFANRCPRVMERCHLAPPPLVEVGEGHAVACYLYS